MVESLLLGTPVVSTPCSGADELLGSNHEYGLVVENSEQGLYDGLHRMLTQPELLQCYALLSKLSVQRFSSEAALLSHHQLFQSLV